MIEVIRRYHFWVETLATIFTVSISGQLEGETVDAGSGLLF